MCQKSAAEERSIQERMVPSGSTERTKFRGVAPAIKELILTLKR
jgi:hypothetical protein